MEETKPEPAGEIVPIENHRITFSSYSAAREPVLSPSNRLARFGGLRKKSHILEFRESMRGRREWRSDAELLITECVTITVLAYCPSRSTAALQNFGR